MNRTLFAIFSSGLLSVSTVSCSHAVSEMPASPLVTLSASPGAVTAGGDVVLTVRAAGMKQVKAAGLQWTFRYDAGSISPISFAVGYKSWKAKKAIACSSQKGETRCLLWGVNANPIPDGEIAEARFRLREGAAIQKAVVTLDRPLAVSGQGDTLAVDPALSTVRIANATGADQKEASKAASKEITTAAVQRVRLK